MNGVSPNGDGAAQQVDITGSEDALDNLVLLSIDSLRADHCGFMGGDWDTTPTLDNLAEDGVVYETAIAPGPRTPSSMPVAFTGRFDKPWEFSWGDWQHRRGRISAHMQRHRTLPERLQAVGYTTVGVTVNPWTQQIDFDKGFNRFIEITGETVTSNGRWNAPILSILDAVLSGTGIGDRYEWHLSKDWFVQWPHYYETILDTLEDVSEPYFLWVFLLDSHQPYLAPRDYRTESSLPSMFYANFRELAGNISDEAFPASVKTRLRQSYRDAIRSTDGFVDRLLGALDREPTVIVHSDHGEAFGDHGTWGHQSELYEENLHVPLMVHDGTHTDRISEPISLRCLSDLATTIVRDARYYPGAFTQDYVMAATEGLNKKALRGNRWKYITDDETETVYDLREDPEETANLGDKYPDITTRLRGQLDRRCEHAMEQVRIAEGIRETTGDGLGGK